VAAGPSTQPWAPLPPRLDSGSPPTGQSRPRRTAVEEVLGSATYEFNWRKDARKFVEHHASVLSTHPTWLFSSGPLGTEKVDKDGHDVLQGAEPKQFADFAELLHPKGTQVFRGAYQPEKIRGADRLIVWMPAIDIMPAGDFREWDAIDAWANSIADHLGAPPVS
jgi:menaquinone-dependent protoporphyrinogen oxidase